MGMLLILRLLTTGRRSKNSSGQLFNERTACDKSQFVTEKKQLSKKKNKQTKCYQLKKKPAKTGKRESNITEIIIIIIIIVKILLLLLIIIKRRGRRRKKEEEKSGRGNNKNKKIQKYRGSLRSKVVRSYLSLVV